MISKQTSSALIEESTKHSKRVVFLGIIGLALLVAACSSGPAATSTPTFAEGEAKAFLLRILDGDHDNIECRDMHFRIRLGTSFLIVGGNDLQEAYRGNGVWEVTLTHRRVTNRDRTVEIDNPRYGQTYTVTDFSRGGQVLRRDDRGSISVTPTPSWGPASFVFRVYEATQTVEQREGPVRCL